MAVVRTVRTRAIEIDGEPFYESSCEGTLLRYALRRLDPVVMVRGTELRWEAIIDATGRRFHGYGVDKATAFVHARDAANAEGALASPWDTHAPMFDPPSHDPTHDS